jgi:hypothetical protein
MAGNWGPVTKPVVSGAKKILSPGDAVENDEHGAKETPRHPNADPADSSAHGWASVDHCSGPVTDGDWSHPTESFPDSGAWKQT